MLTQNAIFAIAAGAPEVLASLMKKLPLAIRNGLKDYNYINWLTVEMSIRLGYVMDHQEMAWVAGLADSYPDQIGLPRRTGFGTQTPAAPMPRRAEVRVDDGVLYISPAGKDLLGQNQDVDRFEVYRLEDGDKPQIERLTREKKVDGLPSGQYFVVSLAQNMRSAPSSIIEVK